MSFKTRLSFYIRKLVLNSVSSFSLTHGAGVHFGCPELGEKSPEMQLE